MPKDEKLVMLLSGGLDSAVVAAWMKSEGFAVHALSFDYGQRHSIELECAKRISRNLELASHTIFQLPMGRFGGSALTDRSLAVPKGGASTGEIPVTYVPARNLVFLSIAVSLAESLGARHIALGVNAVDYSGYPDCRPEFISAFFEAARLGTKIGVEEGAFQIHAPLISLSKPEIIQRGSELGVDFAITSSCYSPDDFGKPCRECDSCRIRESAFASMGVTDPRLSP